MAVTLLVIVGKNMIALFSRHGSGIRHLLKASALNDDRSLKCRPDPLPKVGTVVVSVALDLVSLLVVLKDREHMRALWFREEM